MKLSTIILALSTTVATVTALDLTAAFQQFQSQINAATAGASDALASARSALSVAQSEASTNAQAASAALESAQSALSVQLASGESKATSAKSEVSEKASSVKSEVSAATHTGTETSKADAAAMTLGIAGVGGLAALAGILML
ncbi:uncharacterized protein J8A68_000635 [[Candida] subhashii]|uniref:Uncharacterized protein n=1 Tax=[Candida] subhashii TaxID=561895 RepID=A0A8J5V169_9ASCO|nr:uncharacterized protein J8A68_000635 [[Candida] subhashii]KAG7665810.1 hypothetical protein J8A68_000635 [[Candida] subhashii]